MTSQLQLDAMLEYERAKTAFSTNEFSGPMNPTIASGASFQPPASVPGLRAPLTKKAAYKLEGDAIIEVDKHGKSLGKGPVYPPGPSEKNAAPGFLRRLVSPTKDELDLINARLDRENAQYAMAGGGAMAAAAPVMAWRSPDHIGKIIGGQRFFHGTSNLAGQKIRQEGLDPSHGGTGGAAAEGLDEYVDHSRGKVHVSTDPYEARTYAHVVQDARDGVKPSPLGFVANQIEAMNPFRRKGSVVSGVLPWEEFSSKFEPDPDMPTNTAFRTAEKIDPSVLKKGVRHIAAERMKNPSSLFKYMRNNPARVAQGVGSLASIPALGYGGYKLMQHGAKKSREAKARISEIKGRIESKEKTSALGGKLARLAATDIPNTPRLLMKQRSPEELAGIEHGYNSFLRDKFHDPAKAAVEPMLQKLPQGRIQGYLRKGVHTLIENPEGLVAWGTGIPGALEGYVGGKKLLEKGIDRFAPAASLPTKIAASAPTRGNFMMASDIPPMKVPGLRSPIEKTSDYLPDYVTYNPGDFKRAKLSAGQNESIDENAKDSLPEDFKKAEALDADWGSDTGDPVNQKNFLRGKEKDAVGFGAPPPPPLPKPPPPPKNVGTFRPGKVPGPSIAEIAKPKGAGFGTGIAGAFKSTTGIGGAAPVSLSASPGSLK